MMSKRECEKSNIVHFSSKTLTDKFANDPKPTVSRCSVQISRRINPVWTISRLFGKSHWVGKWVIGLCEFDTQFLLHLIDQSPDYVHFICLVRLALLERSVSEENQLVYAERIRTQSRKKIMRSLYPSVPEGLLGVLAKLQAKPLPKEDYRQLIREMTDDNMRKYFCHTKRVRKFDIYLLKLLENIPEVFRVSGVFNCLKKSDDYKSLLVLIKAVQVLNLEITQQEVETATREMDEFEQIEKWFERKIGMLPFPPPPWQGNEQIKPVRSRSEMQAVADKFENCVMEYVVGIIFGHNYFYVCERTPAVIQIKNAIPVGWIVNEIEGIKSGGRRSFGRRRRSSRDVSCVQKREIKQVFTDAGFLPLTMSDLHCCSLDFLYDRFAL